MVFFLGIFWPRFSAPEIFFKKILVLLLRRLFFEVFPICRPQKKSPKKSQKARIRLGMEAAFFYSPPVKEKANNIKKGGGKGGKQALSLSKKKREGRGRMAFPSSDLTRLRINGNQKKKRKKKSL